MSYRSLPDRHTIGDFISAVMAIDNEQDAKGFYDDYVALVERKISEGTWKSNCGAVAAARSNIGWCFGEGMEPERVAMWVKVCGASHPILGTMTATPTLAECYEAARKFASKADRSLAREE